MESLLSARTRDGLSNGCYGANCEVTTTVRLWQGSDSHHAELNVRNPHCIAAVDMHAGADLEQLLARYDAMCAAAGVKPLPDDEGPRQAKATMGVLLPAFEAEFQQH